MEKTTDYTTSAISDLVRTKIAASINYAEYRKQLADLAIRGMSSAPVQTEANSNYTVLNDARMRRWDKTIQVPEQIAERFRDFVGDHTWLVITESWCGDAAHSIPVMNKLADLNGGISLRLIQRDTHPDLMDAFLTNGTRSIPKLIVFDNLSHEIVGEWGPRPSEATSMAAEAKRNEGSLSKEFKQQLQGWYNRDKGATIMSEIVKLLD